MSAALCGQVEHGWSCFAKGKFCIIAGRPVNKGLGMLQMSVQNGGHEIRLCPRLDGRPDPCPATLPQETRTRRHAHSVEARPIRPELARPDNHARRPEGARREIPFPHRSEERRVGKECSTRW